MGFAKFFPFNNLSVVKNIYILITVITILPITISTLISSAYLYKTGEQENLNYLEKLTVKFAENTDKIIDEKKYNLEQISKNTNIINFLSNQEEDKFKLSAQKSSNEIKSYISSRNSENNLFVFNKNSKCVISCDLSVDIKDLKKNQIFEKALEGKGYISPLTNKQTQKIEVFISHPVMSQKSEIIGFIILKLDEKYIFNDFLEILNTTPNSEFFLINERNSLITKNQKILSSYQLKIDNKNQNTMLSSRIKSKDIKQLLNEPKFIDQLIYRKQEPYRKILSQRMYSSTILPKQGWIIGVSVVKQQILEPLSKIILFNIIIVLVIGAMTTSSALYLGKSISEPIRIMIKIAQAIDREDLEEVKRIKKSVVNTKDKDLRKIRQKNQGNSDILSQSLNIHSDFHQLIHIFIQMVTNFIQKERKLKEEVEELNLMLKIDQNNKENSVKELTENENFEKIKSKIKICKNDIKKI